MVTNNKILNQPYELYIVCRYSPGGNVANGRPYTRAADETLVATECPQGYDPNTSTGLCEISGRPIHRLYITITMYFCEVL